MPKGVYVRTEENNMAHRGHKWSEESKKRFSESLTGKKGRKHSAKAKSNISLGVKNSVAKWYSWWNSLSVEEKAEKMKKVWEGNNKRETSIEKKVREQLQQSGLSFKSQLCICKNRFIVDFYLPDLKLVIECNGDYWHSREERKRRDKLLEEYVLMKGKRILWLWEKDIRAEGFDVCNHIKSQEELRSGLRTKRSS